MSGRVPWWEAACVLCGHRPAAHTNYMNGVPCKCTEKKADGSWCLCRTFVKPEKGKEKPCTEFTHPPTPGATNR